MLRMPKNRSEENRLRRVQEVLQEVRLTSMIPGIFIVLYHPLFRVLVDEIV